MPNKASNQLFLLIKSMSKQEKRYFRIFSSRHSNEKNNYYTLYQVIDRQETYDEEAIIKLLRSHQFVNRLSIAKTRLYDQILKSLSSFHAQKSVDSELFFVLQSIEILYSKALYKAAWKKLNSGVKIAEKNEKTSIMLELNKWKKKLIEKENYQSMDLEQIDKWMETEENIVDQIKVNNALWYVKSKIFKLLFYGGENTQENQAMIKDLMRENIEYINPDDLSIRSTFLYHHLYSAYYFSLGKWEASFEHLKENLDLLQKENWLFSENPFAEISIISNMSYIGLKLDKKDEIQPLMTRIRSWKKTIDQADENLKIRWFYSYYSIFLTQAIKEGECRMNNDEFIELVDEMEKVEEKIPVLRRSDLKMLLAVYAYQAGDHRYALKTTHALLNELSIKQNSNLYFTARFIYLILLIELGKNDYFEVAWSSTKRLLKSHRIENDHFNFLRDVMDAVHKSDINKLSSMLLLPEGQYKQVNACFNFSKWIKKYINTNSNALAS